MGGRDATNHIGLVAETPSEAQYEAAAKTLSRLCARAGGTADDLRECLEAIGYLTPLKTPQTVSGIPAQREPGDSPAAGKSGGATAQVRKMPGTDLCGARTHHMVGDNLGYRRDGRRYCKTCARNRGARKRAARAGRQLDITVDVPARDPKLCGKQLHPRTPENRIVRPDGRTSCRPCANRSKRRRRADNQPLGPIQVELIDEPPPIVATSLRDPRMCARQLHRWSDPGVQKIIKNGTKRRCEKCHQWVQAWNRQQRDYPDAVAS